MPTPPKKMPPLGPPKFTTTLTKPDKYSNMPPDVAAAMRKSDKDNVLAKGKKAMTAGTYSGKGNIQQSTSKPSTKGGAGYIGVGGKKS